MGLCWRRAMKKGTVSIDRVEVGGTGEVLWRREKGEP